MKRYFKETLSILNDCINSLDVFAFERLSDECVEALRRGKKIVVSGLGKNVPVCDKFVGTMNSVGLNACFMNTNSAVHGDLGIVKDGDVVLLLTKSGETIESIYLAQLLKKKNISIWLITFSDNSTLVNMVKNRIILNLSHEGDPWDIIPNNSTTINLILLQGLAMSLIDKLHISLDIFRSNHPGGFIGEQLKNG